MEALSVHQHQKFHRGTQRQVRWLVWIRETVRLSELENLPEIKKRMQLQQAEYLDMMIPAPIASIREAKVLSWQCYLSFLNWSWSQMSHGYPNSFYCKHRQNCLSATGSGCGACSSNTDRPLLTIVSTLGTSCMLSLDSYLLRWHDKNVIYLAGCTPKC